MSARFVVDNSVVMSWCFEDQTNSYRRLSLKVSLPGRLLYQPYGR